MNIYILKGKQRLKYNMETKKKNISVFMFLEKATFREEFY